MAADPTATAACEWCGRAIKQNAEGRWYAVKGEERGYDALTCEATGQSHTSDQPAPSLVELSLRDLLAAIGEAFEAVPCCCNEAYYDRRLIAPDCCHHDLADEFLSTFPCRCGACKRTESWRTS